MPGRLKSVSFTSPYDAEEREIERRRSLAQALSQQAGQPLQTNRMAGRVAIPISPMEGLAQLAQGAAGAYGQKKAGEESKALGMRVSSERAKAIAEALRAGQGTPEMAAGFEYGGAPAQAADPRATYQSLAQSQFPDLQSIGLQGSLPQIPQPPQRFKLRPGETQFSEQGAPIASIPATAPQQAPSNLDRLLRERSALPPGDPRAAIYDNAIRKESETAKQISPTFNMPRQEQIIQTAEGPMRIVNGQAVPITGPGGRPVRAPSGRAGPMSATAQKELIETEEQLQGGQQALSFIGQAKTMNDKALGFTGAGALSAAGSLLPQAVRPESFDATMELTNIVQNTALPQLKAIFGGMPTEGERKILLEMQGSASQPPNVRKGIFDRAEKAVKARLKFSQEKADRLRKGTYFTGEGLPSISPDSGQSILDQADAIIGNR